MAASSRNKQGAMKGGYILLAEVKLQIEAVRHACRSRQQGNLMEVRKKERKKERKTNLVHCLRNEVGMY